jgi:hypothetical protein
MGICGVIVNLKALSPKRQVGHAVTVTGWPKLDPCTHSRRYMVEGGKREVRLSCDQ